MLKKARADQRKELARRSLQSVFDAKKRVTKKA
jgi:hypothetical protein